MEPAAEVFQREYVVMMLISLVNIVTLRANISDL